MSPHIYKTNRSLWFFAALICLLLSSYDIQCVSGLFSGQSRIEDLLSFEFISPLVFSVVIGWLAQCAVIIVFIVETRKDKALVYESVSICVSSVAEMNLK